VTLSDGLEEIGREAYQDCESLELIIMPNAVKAIKDYTFYKCSGLTTVTLGDGLEEIGKRAYHKFTSLEHIMIPRTVKKIHQKAFTRCLNLTNMEFCTEIEASGACEAMRD
jgi:hypothetical protein